MEQEKENHAEANAKGWLQYILEMVQRLETAEEQAIDGPDETDAARLWIEEAPLSILVRTGWFPPGAPESMTIDEYEILLTTGGPALRITGQLDMNNMPGCWPELQYQDWGTPWTEYIPAREYREALQKFASVFWRGDN